MRDYKELIGQIRRVPDDVDAVCRGLSSEQMRAAPAAGEWSLLEIVCHLRDAAEGAGLRINSMIGEDEPPLEPYDPDERAAQRNYRGEDARRALMTLRAFWSGLAYQLEHLDEAQWQRAGRHVVSGRITVLAVAADQLAHGRAHVDQLRAARS